ncbi:hypothetical protein, partial [Solicola sp. PLA-1-18]|uniref:hypothetical protein n=1 Tax=Solicola sp. PLA-1-18 TaxID=3380532 RepID=UPI003B8205AD
MPPARHRAAKHVAERQPRRRPSARVVVAGLATVAVLGTTAAFALPGGSDDTTPTAARAGFTAQAPAGTGKSEAGASRGTDTVSRSAAAARAAIETAPLTSAASGQETSAPALTAKTKMWVADDVDLRTGPAESFPSDGDVAEGKRLDVTGTTDGD